MVYVLDDVRDVVETTTDGNVLGSFAAHLPPGHNTANPSRSMARERLCQRLLRCRMNAEVRR